MTWSTSRLKGSMPLVSSQRPPEHLGAVHLPGDQVGQRAAALVSVSTGIGWPCAGGSVVSPDAGLDGGLLVGGGDILVGAAAVCRRCGGRRGRGGGRPWRQGRGRGDDPGAMLPAHDRIRAASARLWRRREATMPCSTAARPGGDTASEPAVLRASVGSSQARGIDGDDDFSGKLGGGPPRGRSAKVARRCSNNCLPNLNTTVFRPSGNRECEPRRYVPDRS